MKRFLRLLREAAVSAFYNKCFDTAKSAAYSSILSFFPALMVTAAFLSGHISAVVDEISIALGRVLPPDVYEVAEQYLKVQGARAHGLLAGAWFVAIWSASNVISCLIQGFQTAYKAPVNRSIIKSRLVALALLPIAGFPLLLATLLLFFGEQVANWLAAHFIEAQWWLAPAGMAVRWSVAFATSVFVIGLLYHVGPSRRQQWRLIWPGAVLATGAWLGATLGFAWYVRNMARYGELYGSISTAVVLLIWMYIVNLAVIYGCEFNAAYERELSAVEAPADRG